MSPVTRTTQEPGDPDEALIARSAHGDRPAFDLLCVRHLPRLYVLALRLRCDSGRAEELAQDAMMRAWRNAAQFDPRRGRFSAWVNRIAVNLAIDGQRAAPRSAPLSEDLPGSEPDALEALEARDRRALLASGLAALPPRQRAALLLTYAEDRAGRDVAGALGVSTRALEGLLRRGRVFLKEWLLAREA